MEKYFYPAIFTEESDGYSVRFPDLEGCFTEGDTLDEAYQMAFEAVGLFLDNNGSFTFPPASNPKNISLEKDEFLMLVEFDTQKYLEHLDNTPVKKTLTIPSWLNQVAEQKKINFSATLKDALIEKIAE